MQNKCCDDIKLNEVCILLTFLVICFIIALRFVLSIWVRSTLLNRVLSMALMPADLGGEDSIVTRGWKRE